MDLSDVEETLHINKNIINELLNQSPNSKEVEVQRLMQMEVDRIMQRNLRLEKDKNELKDEMLMVKQMNVELDGKIEEMAIAYDCEIARLIDQNDRKEYALQFLEQRLVELEGYLRELAQTDDCIREQLQYFKVNPDLK